MDPVYEETMKRRAERRRKRRIQQQRRAAILAAASFTLGVAVGGCAFGTERKSLSPISQTSCDIGDGGHLDPLLIDSLEAAAFKPQHPYYILDNGLDPDIQTQIFSVCREDRELYAAVMAIAQIESRMDPAAIGDGGKSIGIMQINTAAQKDRIKALGITDLKDPVQSAQVAVDYIDWLTARIESAAPYTDHALYMAYNMGLQGSRAAIASGTTETEYSAAALSLYRTNLAEIGGMEN